MSETKVTFEDVVTAVVYARNNGIEIPFDVSRLVVKNLRPVTEDTDEDESEAPEAGPSINRQGWPTTPGPQDGPHAWTVEQARLFRTRVVYPRNYNAILFEAARGVLTYEEIGELFDLTGVYCNMLARKAGIARHQNPKIHKGKTFNTRNMQ
jgi:hypothetical protein